MLPFPHQSDRRTFSTISGNSWGLPIHLLRGFGIFSNEFFSRISSSNFGLTRLVALYVPQEKRLVWIKDKQARLEDVGKKLDQAKEATEKNLGMGKEAMEEKVEEI